MQLKGLIRFFTILLIIYSIYELSFTWVVRSHENKMAAKAKQWVRINYPNADSATKADAYNARYKRLLDSTKDETVHYGVTGAISYDKAKKEELNLGLDLKGGMNVSMEVELSGMLRSMSNYSKDPNFLKALDNATARKANTGANYIDLFAEEYKKLNPAGHLASLFISNNNIKITDSDASVVASLKKAAGDAFDNTFRVIQTRIDKFGVAQPNINKDRDRNIITVELPGIQDPERVRKYLQSSANLEFWPVYKDWQLGPYFMAADRDYTYYLNGQNAAPPIDTAKNTVDSSKGNPKADSIKKNADSLNKRSFIAEYFKQPMGGGIASISVKDTGVVMQILNSSIIRKDFPSDARFAFGTQPLDKNNKRLPFLPLYVLRTEGKDKAPIDGSVIVSASPSFDQLTNSPTVSMDMNATGSRLWEQLTDRSYKDTMPIAITLDDVVYSAPIAHKGKITGGRTEISGDFTVDEATDLANILKAGRLPAPAKIVAEQQVGPTLGADAVNGGFKAFIFSFIVIFTLMLVYYNSAGWIANIALILNLLFTIGVLTGLGATLTAPGIAGLVLTIGMAVDTNVIIYERIKEELTKGKGYIPAVNEGYKRSLPPVLDAHVTTLLTAIILFSFGLGPVKGFATTQIIGILLSLFCGILVSRWVTAWFTDKKRHMEYFTPISKRIFKHANFKFIEYRKIAYGISVLVLVFGIGSIFHGFDEGVEFKGGRSYTVRFDHTVSANEIESIRKDLTATFGEGPTIKTVGGNRQLNITTVYKIGSSGTNIDNEIAATLMTGLKNHLPANLSFEQFDKNYKIGYTKVEPTISDKLKQDAKWATFWSLLIIALYIFVRFRDWRYSLGTIVALLHDVLVTLAVFSFFKDIVPFPLELDQHFIAAVLTVIGFSMNDTVIVFDRIREYSHSMVGATKATIINKAVNDTLSRTIMTSLTVFLTILILFLVGGEVTKGFAFAMLIGVITGTYSSVFVAAPILVDLGGKKALGSETKAEKRATAAAEKKAAMTKPKHA
jgi:SecD/SecF fusion protein